MPIFLIIDLAYGQNGIKRLSTLPWESGDLQHPNKDLTVASFRTWRSWGQSAV